MPCKGKGPKGHGGMKRNRHEDLTMAEKAVGAVGKAATLYAGVKAAEKLGEGIGEGLSTTSLVDKG